MVKISVRRQQGVALPVILIILVVMLVSTVYLLKSSNSSTLSASNMAYDTNLSMAADLGLHTAFTYLQARAKTNKELLLQDDAAGGYFATYNPNQEVSEAGFWTNAKSVQAGSGNFVYTVQYVVHRACTVTGGYDLASNACILTSANPSATDGKVEAGDSLDAGGVLYLSGPQVHYIITARIFGPRGGNVVNQMVVLIDG